MDSECQRSQEMWFQFHTSARHHVIGTQRTTSDSFTVPSLRGQESNLLPVPGFTGTDGQMCRDDRL